MTEVEKIEIFDQVFDEEIFDDKENPGEFGGKELEI